MAEGISHRPEIILSSDGGAARPLGKNSPISPLKPRVFGPRAASSLRRVDYLRAFAFLLICFAFYLSYVFEGDGSNKAGAAGSFRSVSQFLTVTKKRMLPPANDSIGAIYITFRRPKPFLYVASSYRDSYPQESFYVVCDSGCYDFRDAAKTFDAKFVGPKQITMKNGRMFMGPDELMTLFATWLEILEVMPEEYFLHLEDDVRVLKRVDFSSLTSDINGAVSFAELSPPLEEWILKKNPNPPGREINKGKMYLGGMGGNIYRAAFWREKLKAPTLRADVTSLIEESEINAVDHLCSALTYAWNGTVGFYDGYGPGWSIQMGQRWFEEKISVLHDDKTAYSQNLTAEDLAALGPNWNKTLILPGTPEIDLTRGGNGHLRMKNQTFTPTKSPDGTPSATPASMTSTPSPTPSPDTLSGTPSATETPTSTPSETETPPPSPNPTISPQPAESESPTPTPTATTSPLLSPIEIVAAAMTDSESIAALEAELAALSAPSLTSTPSQTLSPTPSPTVAAAAAKVASLQAQIAALKAQITSSKKRV